MTGWLRLHRQLLEWEWYQCVNTTRVFLHLLLTASWRDARWQGIDIPRGSVFASPDTLATATGLSRQQVRTVLARLQSTNEISTRTTNKGTLITLRNFDSYNPSDSEAAQPVSQPPVKPKSEKTEKPKREWTPDEVQVRVANWFNRRVTTPWNEKELRAWKTITDKTPETLDALEAYYTADIQKDDYRRHDLCTLLNNWAGETDRAHAYIKKHGKDTSTGLLDF
jgi:hypothetical protein